MAHIPNKNLLVLSAIASDQTDIVNSLSATIFECGCSIADSRMTVLGQEFAVIMLVSGTWDAVAKLENALPRLEKRLNLALTVKRTEAREVAHNLLSYAVEVVAMDHPGIVREIAQFFSERQINVEDLFTSTYPAAHTGTPMFSMNMTISIPADLSIATLRTEFLDLCDDLNLDAIMSPIK